MGEDEIWWQKNPLFFEAFKLDLEDFTFLTFEVDDLKVIIRGRWPVSGATELITYYDIKILVPDDFPESPPRVFETGGRIPKEPDYHINPEDKSACLFAKPERYEKWPHGCGIREFLNGPVKEFFFSQAFKELKGVWPFGEWSHGDEGILEYYALRLGTGKLDQIEPLLRMSILPKYHRQWRCPCQSRERVTKCHAKRLNLLRESIPVTEIQEAIKIVQAKRAKGITEVRLRQ